MRKTAAPAGNPPILPRQMQILRMIRDGQRTQGFSPTMQEMGDQMGVTKVTVFEHVEALIKNGYLLRSRHKARSLELTSQVRFPEDRPTRLPLAGRIAAGHPIEAIEDQDALDLEEFVASRFGTFVLKVTGDSMIDDHICDGDYVIVEKRERPEPGDTVVALLENGEATLKRFYREGNRVRLQPANRRFKPIYASNVDIQGVVIGVVRQYR